MFFSVPGLEKVAKECREKSAFLLPQKWGVGSDATALRIGLEKQNKGASDRLLLLALLANASLQ